jgi:methionine synthase I (cobalamin-dependent)
MDHPISTRTTRIAALHDALEQRILVLDGAMGTMVQRYQLTRSSSAASASAISIATCAATTTCSRSLTRK